MRRLLALAGLLACLTLGTAAPALADSLSIDTRADYVTPTTVNVSGSATCTDPTGVGTVTLTNVGGPTFAGQTEVVCDGQPHTWAATLTAPAGGFQQGGSYGIRGTLTTSGWSTNRTSKIVVR